MSATLTAPTARERRLSVDAYGVRLGATLTVPAGEGPFPAAVLVTGSGPLDRDGNHGRKRIAVSRRLAGALADAGVASVRFDKRGVGESPGDWRAAGFTDNVDDVQAVVHWLRSQPEILTDRVVAVGHSEGANLVTAVAGRGVPVAGVALLAGSARPGEKVLQWQARVIAPTLPRPVRALMRLLRVDLEKKVAANHAKVKATTTDVARLGGARINARWLREFMAYDPQVDLAKIAVPVLALTGAKDLQVPAEDVARIAELVRGPVETHVVSELSHLLRRQSGPASLSRYKEELRRQMDDEVLAIVVSWCQRTLLAR